MTIGDIDEFASIMVGWDSDWRQLEPGQPTNHIELVRAQSMVMQRVRLSHAIHQQGTSPKDLVTFGIPRSRGPSVWGGQKNASLGIFDFNGASGYDCVSENGFDGLTLSFPRERLSAIAERLEADAEPFFDGRVWGLNERGSEELREFHRYLYELFDRATVTSDFDEQAHVRKLLDEQLPERLLFAMVSQTREKTSPSLKDRQKGVRQSIRYMDEHCHLSPSIPEVAVAVGLSWRTLDRGFKEHFGIGPKRYLLNLRLTRARRALKSVAEGTKVVDVANEWGFWHMGDFAREYKQLFGELPTQSLSR